MMVFREPQRKDVELAVAGEHRIERGEIAKRLFHHLRPRIDEDRDARRGPRRVAAPRYWRRAAAGASIRPGPFCRASG